MYHLNHRLDHRAEDLSRANLTGADLEGVKWEKEHPPKGPARCDPLDEVKFPKRKGRISFAQAWMHFLKKLNPCTLAHD